MKKYFTVFIMLIAFGGFFAYANAKKESKQTKCPICKMDVKKSVYTDYEGVRVYFCSKHCVEKFKKDPKKYISEMKKNGVALEKVKKVEKTEGKKPGCSGLPCEATCNKK